MPTTTVGQNIQFSYHEVPPIIEQDSRFTLVVVHGHTYHSGAFVNFAPLAAARNVRTILVNRRGYPGSTPYTDDESRILNSGTFNERSELFDKEGEYLALFLYNIIQEHGLQRVVVLGWSLGVAFISMVVNSIKRLDDKYKDTLQANIHGFMYWDPPANIIGVDMPEDGWIPLYDETLPPEERGPAFGKWVASYFQHEDIHSRDFKKLARQGLIPTNPLAFANQPIQTLQSMADFTAGDKGDNSYGAAYVKAEQKDLISRALLDPDVRDLWRNAKFYCLYGEQCSWNVLWGAWGLEDMIKEADDEKLTLIFKPMKGANHFTMYDNPELLLDTIQSCVNL